MKTSAVSVLLLIVLVALLVIPLPRDFNSLWGPSPLEDDDVAYSLWLCWYFKDVWRSLLTSPRTAMKTDHLYHPKGYDIYLETPNVMGPVSSVPFLTALGFPRGVNVLVTVLVLANAVAAWWVLRKLGINPLLAVTGSLMFSINPFVVEQMVYYRFEHLILFLIPLFMMSFIRMLAGGRGRCLTTVGLFMLLCLNDWFHGIFAALLGAAVFAGEFVMAKKPRRRLLKRLIAFIVLYLALSAPFLFPFASKIFQGDRVFGLSLASGLRLNTASQQMAGGGGTNV